MQLKTLSRICSALALTALLAPLSGCIGVLPMLPEHPLANKTEADVLARRESLMLDFVYPSPAGTQMLYSYQRRFEVDVKMGAAVKTWVRSMQYEAREALWLRDAQGKDRRVLAGVLSQGDRYVWIDEASIAWLAASKELIQVTLADGARRVLASGDHLDMLQKLGDELFFVRRELSGSTLVRLNPVTGVSQSVRLPAGAYMYASQIQILDRERVLVDMAKPASEQGEFHVATSPIPNLQDAFLVDFAGGLTRLTAAAERRSGEQLIMAPDQSQLLMQGYQDSALYDAEGDLVKRIQGRAFWIDKQRVLSLGSDHVDLYAPDNLNERFDRSGCSSVGLQGSFVLVQCPLADRIHTRIYKLDGSLQELGLGLSARGNADLLSDGMLADEPGPEGYAAFYRLDAKGEPQQVLKLPNPAKADFSFDPKAGWTGGF